MARPKAFDVSATLDKAVDLFWRQGYHATSIQDVVDHLGVNRASLYDTYGDKRTLFLKALERYRENQLEAMRQLFTSHLPVRMLLRRLLDQVVREGLGDRNRKGCFMVNTAVELASLDPELAAIATGHWSAMEQVFTAAIAAAQQRGEIDPARDARALARFFVNGSNGLRVAAKMSADPDVLADIVGVTLRVLD